MSIEAGTVMGSGVRVASTRGGGYSDEGQRKADAMKRLVVAALCLAGCGGNESVSAAPIGAGVDAHEEIWNASPDCGDAAESQRDVGTETSSDASPIDHVASDLVDATLTDTHDSGSETDPIDVSFIDVTDATTPCCDRDVEEDRGESGTDGDLSDSSSGSEQDADATGDAALELLLRECKPLEPYVTYSWDNRLPHRWCVTTCAIGQDPATCFSGDCMGGDKILFSFDDSRCNHRGGGTIQGMCSSSAPGGSFYVYCTSLPGVP